MTNTINKRGRKNVLPDAMFIEYFSKAESVADVAESLRKHVDSLSGEDKEKFQTWLDSKDQKDLELFVSAKASALRKKGVVFSNSYGTNKFRVGRRMKNTSDTVAAKTAIKTVLEEILEQETSDIAV